MYRKSLSNLLGGSLLVASIAAACGSDPGTGEGAVSAGTGAPITPSAGTPATGAAGKPAGSAGSTSAAAGNKAAAGTPSTPSGAAGKAGGAGATAAAAGSGTAAAGSGPSAAASTGAAAGATAAAGTGAAAGSGAAAAAGSSGAAAGGPLKFTGPFTMGMTFPEENRCPTVGENKSPALAWTGGPADTKSYALVLFDTGFSLLHYVLWDIPASVHELPAGLGSGYELMNPMGAHQAAAMCNRTPAYCGPCSGEGTLVSQPSTYELRLYAMKVDKLGLTESSTAAQAQMAVESMMLEKAVWTGKPM
jgi:phosphatidylethanolamine-binding protein (PEBP) family uncharacterized protein